MTPTLKEIVENIETYIELYPTSYNGEVFMVPLGWTKALSTSVGEKIRSSLNKVIEERDKEITDKIMISSIGLSAGTVMRVEPFAEVMLVIPKKVIAEFIKNNK